MANKFDFNEIVKIISSKTSLREINGFEGVIVGRSQNESTGNWGYAVSIYKDEGLVWDILEEDLQSTGRKENSNTTQTRESIKVQVDTKTGEGRIGSDSSD